MPFLSSITLRRLALIASLLPLPALLSGQSAHGSATITAQDIAQRIRIISDDSMMGRDTPSRGLDLTAQFVAQEFKKAGLKPAGEGGTWYQRYRIQRRQLDLSTSKLVLQAGANRTEAPFSSSVRHVTGQLPEQPVAARVVLLGGRATEEQVLGLPCRDRVVVVVLEHATAVSQTANLVLRRLYERSPTALLWASMDAPAEFASRLPKKAPERLVIGIPNERPAVLELPEAALAGLLAAAGRTAAELRGSQEQVFQEIPDATVKFDLKDVVLSADSAPNTIGMLVGSDPVLKNQYVMFSAHMDHLGILRGQPDSIANGADDNASGTTGVITLARAFGSAAKRPRRSLLFMTVSGEEKGLWGSRYFLDHPTVPVDSIVADLNTDMIGRNWRDTIAVIGKENSDLGTTLARVAAAHPELHMTPVPDQWPSELLFYRSDHYNFAREGVPILFFFNGLHEDYHKVTDSADKIDAEKESRIVKLVYYVGEAVANTTARPQWNPESYRHIVQGER